jgi:serine/threonine protein kinase
MEDWMEILGRSVSNYRFERVLTKDAAAVTYAAFDSKKKRTVCFSVVTPVVSAAQAQIFIKRIKQLSKLKHPNIVRFYDADRVENKPYLIAEYVDGVTLDRIFEEKAATFSNVEIIDFGIQVAKALRIFHRVGLVQGVLKPSNILLTRSNQAKVFASAALRDLEAGIDEFYDDPVQWKKSIPYLDPEQFSGRSLDARSDLYGLGVLLYRMATARLPYPPENLANTVQAVMYESAPPAERFNPALERKLGLVIDRLLEKNPDSRIQTAVELERQLEDIAASLHPSIGNRAWQATKSPILRATGAVGSAVVAAVGTLLRYGISWNRLPEVSLPPSLPSEMPGPKEPNHPEAAAPEVAAEKQKENAGPSAQPVAASIPGAEFKSSDRRTRGRVVNCWFEGDGSIPPLVVGRRYSFKLNIGSPRKETSGTSTDFKEPDFGELTEINLLVSFFSSDFEIDRSKRNWPLTLCRTGDTDTVETNLKPIHAGECTLEIVISLAKELEVLQALEVEINAVEQAVVLEANG